LLKEPGDLNTEDIQEFVVLSSTREASERKEREDALAQDEMRLAQIKASQERTARLQRFTRWAYVAIGAVILIAGAAVAYLQAEKQKALAESTRQLATNQIVLAESKQQLEEAQASVSLEQARNSQLRDSLNKRQLVIDHA
jgi:hypothetical protein